MALTYSITGGTDGAKFNINATSGALTFKVAPDFEAPGDADHNNVYQVEVGVSDGTTTTKQMLNITVTDKPENQPPQFTSPAAFTVPENQTTVATLTANDPDSGGPPVQPPVTGDWPGAGNTGVPAGTTLTPHSGNLVTTQAGQIIMARDVSGSIEVQHPNVKIQKCKAGHIIAHDGSDRSGLLVEDTEVRGTPGWNSAVSVVYANGFTMRRCNVHSTERGIWMQSHDALLENNYFHDLINNTGTHDPHIDGIQIPDAQIRNAVLRNNNVDCVKNISASITMKNAINLRAEHNRLNGGSYTMYVEGNSTGCVFDGNEFIDCYYGWIAGQSCAQQTYTNNTFRGELFATGYPQGGGQQKEPKEEVGKERGHALNRHPNIGKKK